jgi:hypothetical protein
VEKPPTLVMRVACPSTPSPFNGWPVLWPQELLFFQVIMFVGANLAGGAGAAPALHRLKPNNPVRSSLVLSLANRAGQRRAGRLAEISWPPVWALGRRVPNSWPHGSRSMPRRGNPRDECTLLQVANWFFGGLMLNT